MARKPRRHPEGTAPGDRRQAARALLGWYAAHRRDLPWRRRPEPYRVWLSEVMLQQTQVETVLPYYRRFLERFPDLAGLARAGEDEVLALWSGLGYYRRARDLHAAARTIAREHGGEFPRDLRAALALPGVGPYTAGAVLSIAYGLPVPVVDGNVERVLSRWLALPGDPRSAPNRRRLREEAEGMIPAGRAGDLNQALMELGALLCLPASPRCPECPLRASCRARAGGDPERFPEKAPGRPGVAVHLAVLVVLHRGRVLIERRTAADEEGDDGRARRRPPSPAYLRGLWNFPAIEVEDPETGPALLAARLRERWGGSVRVEAPLGTARHSITFRRITVHAWRARVERAPAAARAGRGTGNGGGAGRGGRRFIWAAPAELGSRYPAPSLALKVLGLLERGPGRERER